MKRSAKLAKTAELPFFGAIFITIAAGSVMWGTFFYGIYLIISSVK